MRNIGRIKHFASFLWDFPIEKVESEKNGSLQVVYQYGRYILNSNNANYSFQQLHRVFQRGLAEIRSSIVPKKILNLGMGGGSTLHILRNELNWNAPVISVEHDPVIIDLAKKYFGISQIENHEVVESDALDFISECNELFDLVIVDLFKDRVVPNEFLEIEFFQSIHKLMPENGIVVANFISEDLDMNSKLQHLESQLNGVFSNVKFMEIHGINRFAIMSK